MTIRSISKIGLVNIGRQVRGEALEGQVVLRLIDGGITMSPYDPICDAGVVPPYLTRFDQYNRISLPSALRSAANIKKRIDVTLVGEKLIITPVTDVCVFCGTEKNLTNVSDGKYICDACRKTMIQVGKGQGE